MAYGRQFSTSIFLICLLEFVFWFYCTVSAAGVAEEMYMTQGIETFKHSSGAHESELAGATGQEASRAVDEKTAGEASLHEPTNLKPNDLLTNLVTGGDYGVGRLGVWIAVAVGLLGIKFLFPHHVKKITDVLFRPYELCCLLKFKFFYKVPEFPKNLSKEDRFSYGKLPQVSRSFTAVIAELPEELRRPIANFYLVLRGLDTIEDDMSIPLSEKVPHLIHFWEKLYVRGWNVDGYGDNPHEADLLRQFHFVIEVFRDLKPEYQEVIADITKRMGAGMAKFAQDKQVVTLEDYNEYCHYVAGLVGIGLSKMFAASGLESDKFANLDELSNSMGLFLQKTNVTRDYLEDVTAVNPRIFYPKDIWGKYAKNIVELKEPENKEAALKCLNEMVTNAMAHITDCLDYMMLLTHPQVFKFCGIPQAMAIATLARIYNNYDVFKKEVKIRKGEAVQMMMYGGNYEAVIGVFLKYIAEMESKIPEKDPNAEKMRHYIAVARERIAKGRGRQQ